MTALVHVDPPVGMRLTPSVSGGVCTDLEIGLTDDLAVRCLMIPPRQLRETVTMLADLVAAGEARLDELARADHPSLPLDTTEVTPPRAAPPETTRCGAMTTILGVNHHCHRDAGHAGPHFDADYRWGTLLSAAAASGQAS